MKKNHNWLIDVLLFLGFLVLFFLDLTGLAAHQWLGVFIGLLAFYHMIKHWKWLTSIADRFLHGTTWRARLYMLIDLSILAGFFTILATGLAMSTWFDLPLSDYFAWKNVHTVGSLLTLAALIMKLLLHWRWILNAFRKTIRPVATAYDDDRFHVPENVVVSKERRDFLRLMLFLGATSAAAVVISTTDKITGIVPSTSAVSQTNTLATSTPQPTAFQSASATSNPTSVAQVATNTAAPTQAAVPTATAAPCTILCSRGCAYPGACRRYIDRNGNGLCDNGECL